MLFEFKSRATGSVVMTGDVGKRVLALIGRSPDPQGIITVAQMPAAIAALRRAADDDRAARRLATGDAPRDDRDARDDDTPREEPVGLAQRVFPLIEILEVAHRAGKDVTWGA